MTKPITGRRWKVATTGYFGTPKASKAQTPALRRKYAMEGGPVTAAGDRVSVGDLAVPSNIPLGTVIFIPGYGWGIAKDHGGAIKGNRIDLAFGGVNAAGTAHNPEAELKANQWGRRSQTVYVFPPSFKIPEDHSPPQAYKNDLANKGKTQAAFKVSSILPPSRGVSIKSITSKKQAIALRDELLKNLKKGPVIPTTKPANPDSKAWSAHLDLFDWKDPVHGSSDPNKFLGWSEIGSRVYKQKIDNIINGDESPEQKIASINQVKDGIAYQLNKNRLVHKDATSASEYGDTKIESLQRELTGATKQVEPAIEDKFILKNQNTSVTPPQVKPIDNSTVTASNAGKASPKLTKSVELQATIPKPNIQPKLNIKPPVVKTTLAKDENSTTRANPAKPSTVQQPVQTSMPSLSRQVRSGVTSSVPAAEIKSNSKPALKGPTGQVVLDMTKKPRPVVTSGEKSLAPSINEPLPSIDPVKTVAPKVSSQDVQQRKPNTVLTEYVKRINTIDSLVDPSQYLQRKKLFLKEQAAIKDVNNNLTTSDRKKLLDTLGAYPEDNRKPQTLGGVVRAGNNSAKGGSQK